MRLLLGVQWVLQLACLLPGSWSYLALGRWDCFSTLFSQLSLGQGSVSGSSDSEPVTTYVDWCGSC